MADVGAEETAIWVGLNGPHVVVTMAGERAVQLAGTLARSDVADSAEVAELVQLLAQATAERQARGIYTSTVLRQFSAPPLERHSPVTGFRHGAQRSPARRPRRTNN